MLTSHPVSRRTFLRGLRGGSRRPSLEPSFTPVENFYRELRNHYPSVASQHWRFTLTASAQRHLTLTYTDVFSQPLTTVDATLCSVGRRSGPDLIAHGRWSGVPLASVMQQTGTKSTHSSVHVLSADGRDTVLPLDMLENALLACELNGTPLPAPLGGPVRLILPGAYDHQSPGWVTRVELLDEPHPGFWERAGWRTNDVQTLSFIDRVASPAQPGNSLWLTGAAYAGLRRITAVELSIGGSEWTPVEFQAAAPGCWTRWRALWTPPADGDYTVRVRAADERDGWQSESAAGSTVASNPSGLHTMVISVGHHA